MGITGKIVRCCSAIESLGDVFIRLVGPLYVLLGVSLIVAVASLLLFVILPLTHRAGDPAGFAALAATSFVFFNVLFNYFMAVRVDPGSPTSKDVQLMCAEAGAGVRRWCHKCRCPKPELAHHCRVCRRCVLKMDHHCPWLHNCVGHRNYRYFFNFLAWLWLGCLLTVFSSASHVFGGDAFKLRVVKLGGGATGAITPSAVRDPVDVIKIGEGALGVGLAHSAEVRLTADQHAATTFSCVLAASIFCALCLLWFWHVYLVLTAQTTVEYHRFREARKEAKRIGVPFVNPHDRGWRGNWQEVFDERGRYWFLAWAMPRIKPHRGTGVPIVT